jgi:hypothetical protein
VDIGLEVASLPTKSPNARSKLAVGPAALAPQAWHKSEMRGAIMSRGAVTAPATPVKNCTARRREIFSRRHSEIKLPLARHAAQAVRVK